MSLFCVLFFYFFQDYHFFVKVPTAGSSWVVWNLFDFPAGILPITKVNEEDENALNTSYPRNDVVIYNFFQLLF